MARPRVLTIAGSDPSGGAGVEADLKTFAALGCHGMAVAAVLTAQDTTGVRAVHVPPAAFTRRRLELLLADCPPRAVKTGMLYEAAVVEVAAACLAAGAGGPLVVDPVMAATSGDALLVRDAADALVRLLLPLAACVTPNADEAAALRPGGRPVVSEDDAWSAAEEILTLGPRAVLVKGGHLEGEEVVDVLLERSGARHRWVRPRVPGLRAHGAGCTLSAGIAAGLARGRTLPEAVGDAGAFVHAALVAALPQGHGAVPLDHCVPFRRTERP